VPTSVTLRDARSPETVVGSLSMQAFPAGFRAVGELAVAAADRDAMFDLLAGGNARLVVQLANGTSFTTALVVATREDWHRPKCD
jgi:hypothetical protein